MTRIRLHDSLFIALLIGVLTVGSLLLVPATGRAQPEVGEVQASWEDSLAVILPEILDPFSPSLRQTLRSGVPLFIDLEVRFTRTGFAKSEHVPVKVEYDVWTGWYRVHTPLSPLAIEEYTTVERLFERDMALFFDRHIVDPNEDWFIKVRVGARVADSDDGHGGRSGVEDDLSGITRFIFKLFGDDPDMSDWSELVKLPRRGTP